MKIDLTNPTQIFGGGSNGGRRICIVGGGIGGLTAALAFARSGASVEVHEQAPAITEVGAGIQITPNGARALEALGLGAALDACGIRSQAVEPMDGISGKRITRFDLSQIGGPAYRFLHRADLIGVLVEACSAAGVVIHLNAHVRSADMNADLVIGAEGVHSLSRIVLNGEVEPFFTGQVAWRAVIRHHDPHQTEASARIWMAPRRHAVTYPLSGDRLNIVAVQERQQWAAEGWDCPDDAGNLRQAFRTLSGRLTGLLEQVEDVRLWGLFRHPVAQVWAKDNLVILGDAAHPTLPFLAQGANLAIEDAYVLAQSCDRSDNLDAALARYQSLRQPRVTRAIAGANANAVKYHLDGLPRRAAHVGLKSLGLVAPRAFLRRMDWLYGYDVTRLT